MTVEAVLEMTGGHRDAGSCRNVAVKNRDGGICPKKRQEEIVTVEAVRRKLPGRMAGVSRDTGRCPKRGGRTT